MKDKSVFLKLLLIFGLLMISVVSVSAQEIDVDSMSNEQLMALLQAIMQKLENDEGGMRNEELKIENGELIIGEADDPIFQIYENKKLILERLPDWYFVQKKTGGDDDEDDNPPSKPGMTPEECEKDCWDKCDFDMGCFSLCYYPKCEPVPDWLKDSDWWKENGK